MSTFRGMSLVFWKDWNSVKDEMPPVRRVFINEVLGEFPPLDPGDVCSCGHHVEQHVRKGDPARRLGSCRGDRRECDCPAFRSRAP